MSALAKSAETSATGRGENLALLFQEILTVTGRLRDGRQEVSSAEAFRGQAIEAIRLAGQQAQTRGYTGADIQLATFAIVAFLDESILNLRSPVFKDWARRPLQEELFGRHEAGETFFEYLQQLIKRRDAPETADAIEVYYLCLLLGYLGRYSIASKAELRSLMQQAEEKIARIRGTNAEMSPHWRLPEETTGPAAPDRWQKWFYWAAISAALLAPLCYPAYWLLLRSGVERLQELGGR